MKTFDYELLKIFQFYSSFGDRTNVKNLQANKFQKMMFDTGIAAEEFNTKNTLDLLFVKVNAHKNNMEY